MMQKLMEVKYDNQIKDAAKYHAATRDDVRHFSNDPNKGPDLLEFRPFWEDIDHPWNAALAANFAAMFQEVYPNLASSERVIEHFMSRLRRHSKGVNAVLATSASVHQASQDPKKTDKRRRARQRKVCRTKKLTSSYLLTLVCRFTPSALTPPKPSMRDPETSVQLLL